MVRRSLGSGPRCSPGEPRKHLTSGDLQAAVQEFEAHLVTDPADDHSRFALGMTRLLTAVERLSQNLFWYGLRVSAPDLPVLRLPVPENPDPEPLTYPQMRALLQPLIDDLAVAADVLSPIKDPNVKLHVPWG